MLLVYEEVLDQMDEAAFHHHLLAWQATRPARLDRGAAREPPPGALVDHGDGLGLTEDAHATTSRNTLMPRP
jgi:hypothetical protein